MINNWLKFNDNKNSDRENIINVFNNVRECFLEWEDINIVKSYRFSDSSLINYSTYSPKSLKDEKFFIDQTMLINKFNKIKFIMVDINFPGVLNNNNSMIFDSSGIKMFDDIIVINNRLSSLGYVVKLDMNSNHFQFKPVIFLIGF